MRLPGAFFWWKSGGEGGPYLILLIMQILYYWCLNILPVLMFDKSDSFFYKCSSTYHLLCNTGSDKVIVRTTTVPPTKLVLSDGMQLVS